MQPHFYGIKYALSAVFISFILLAIFDWLLSLITQSTKQPWGGEYSQRQIYQGKTVYPNGIFDVRDSIINQGNCAGYRERERE
jgi:GH15 family glucan-1,4-alpha-glucosidase